MAVGLFAKVAGAWQEIGSASGGVPWAKVSGGTVTEYTKPDGSVMEVHTFTANGTLTVDTPGYAEVLLVGGGASGYQSNSGMGGDVRDGLWPLPAGGLTVTVGGGGGASASDPWGRPSSIQGVVASAASGEGVNSGLTPGAGASIGSPATMNAGAVVSITGTPVEYARANQAAPRANLGDGGSTTDVLGAKGIVIVAVQKSAPTVSGVVASGGTESTYVGDGVNGVLGQTYKVHKFTANGMLTVSQAGLVDVLVVGGGGAGGNDSAGGGGGVISQSLYLQADTYSASIGAGATGITGNIGTVTALAYCGGNTVFGNLVAGGGGHGGWTSGIGGNGGSGGGGTRDGAGGLATFGPQGNAGGATSGSGGGAGGAGQTFAAGGVGGAGLGSYITGSLVYYGAGGNSKSAASTAGGQAAYQANAAANTGGGAGAGGTQAGGSGVVIVRYKVA